MPSAVIDINDAIDELRRWLAEDGTRDALRDAAIIAISRAEESYLFGDDFRVPRSKSMRDDMFAAWIEGYRHRLESEIAKEVHRRLDTISLANARLAVASAMSGLLPDIERRANRLFEALTTHAIQALALTWTSKFVSDGIAVGAPTRDGANWRVPLYSKSTRQPLESLIMDANGDVLSSASDISAAADRIA